MLWSTLHLVYTKYVISHLASHRTTPILMQRMGGEEPRRWETGGRGRERESPGTAASPAAGAGAAGREGGFEKIRTRSRSHSMHMVDVSGESLVMTMGVGFGLVGRSRDVLLHGCVYVQRGRRGGCSRVCSGGDQKICFPGLDSFASSRTELTPLWCACAFVGACCAIAIRIPNLLYLVYPLFHPNALPPPLSPTPSLCCVHFTVSRHQKYTFEIVGACRVGLPGGRTSPRVARHSAACFSPLVFARHQVLALSSCSSCFSPSYSLLLLFVYHLLLLQSVFRPYPPTAIPPPPPPPLVVVSARPGPPHQHVLVHGGAQAEPGELLHQEQPGGGGSLQGGKLELSGFSGPFPVPCCTDCWPACVLQFPLL